jgi:hypothetical protein
MNTNEMFGDYATLSYPTPEPAASETEISTEPTPEITVADTVEVSPSLEGELYAYPLEVTLTNSDEQWVYLALTLNVSVANNSVKVIKKLKVCKESLRGDFLVQLNKPATVVESIKSKDDLNKRMRELAGIPNKKNFV